MLTVIRCHSECCVPSGLDVNLLLASLYIIVCPVICLEGIESLY